MKKFSKLLLTSASLFTLFFTGCNNDKIIKVCASDVPHAEILSNCVKGILKEQGYTLNVKVLDWTVQNDAVANKDYDANYFQHIPYLLTYEGTDEKELIATCKVHYEPLGIYRGNFSGALTEGLTFEICSDTSNAIRAFELLKAKGVLDTIPVNEDKTALTFEGSSWYSEDGKKVTLIEESLLVSSMDDYNFALLPCNTAYTGNVPSERQVAKEDDPEQVSNKANVLAVRKQDYLNNETYKAKIDVLTDALLSDAVSTYINETYLSAITCDDSSQIDLRSSIQ